MSQPEKMTDNPEVQAIVVLMLDKLMPALEHGRGYGAKAFPDDADFAMWTNGAIFGTVAHFITTNRDEADLDEITKIYGCLCDVINETLDRYGRFDLEQYATDFLERVGAEMEKGA